MRALHVRASAWLSLLRSAELEGMVWQRLIPRLADGCARMPAAHKDILSCGDPVRAQVIAPPQGSCHRVCSLHVRASAWLSLLSRSVELEGMMWQRLITRLADGCARMLAALKDIFSCGDAVGAQVIAICPKR